MIVLIKIRCVEVSIRKYYKYAVIIIKLTQVLTTLIIVYALNIRIPPHLTAT